MKVSQISYQYANSFLGRNNVSSPNTNVPQAPLENLSPEERLKVLFPNNGLEKAYNDICKYLNLDYKPELKLVDKDECKTGGAFYRFKTNTVVLEKSNLCFCDYKVVGRKNGKKFDLAIPDTYCQFVANKEYALKYINETSKDGFDSLEVEPTTFEEQRKYIIQIMCHELIHAHQKMIMRKTEDIGTRRILAAEHHIQPKDTMEAIKLVMLADCDRKNSFWANIPDEPVITKDHPMYAQAHEWLEAAINYPTSIDDEEYKTNLLEKDAHLRAAKYIYQIYGNQQK